MDVIKIIIVSIFIFVTINSAHAAEFSIVAWPDKNNDFAKAVKIVASHAPAKYMLSVWGWEKLEPEKGDTDALTKELGGVRYSIANGLNQGQYYGVTVIDTVKRVLPSDIMDISWDDPALIKRYADMIGRLKAELATPPDYLVIANESDVYFENHPDEIEAFLKFAVSAQKIVKDIFPTTKVGFTVTFESLSKGGARTAFAKQLIGISDAAFLTYYPIIDMIPTKPEDTPTQLDMILKIAGEKPVILQEIGYPSIIKGSSEAQQAQFFETIIPAIQKRPQIKFASIFALHDFDEKGCKGLIGYYGMDGLFSMTQQGKDFQSFLCSLGLLHADGSPKPAWDAAMKAFGTLALQSENENGYHLH